VKKGSPSITKSYNSKDQRFKCPESVFDKEISQFSEAKAGKIEKFYKEFTKSIKEFYFKIAISCS